MLCAVPVQVADGIYTPWSLCLWHCSSEKGSNTLTSEVFQVLFLKWQPNFWTNRMVYQSLPMSTSFRNDAYFKKNSYMYLLGSSSMKVSEFPSQRQFQCRILIHVLEHFLRENSGLRNELWIFCQAPDKCKKWICLRSSKSDTNYVCKVLSIVS